MLTAAPIIRKPMEKIGAPGMTDYLKIYIASELNKDEYRTVLRHEQAHVWAGHNRRRPQNVKADLWRIACEMEIARSIYDAEDIFNITAPRSRLRGGYLPDTLPNLPTEVVLAEDIYEWLLAQPQKEWPKILCGCDCCAETAQDDVKEHDLLNDTPAEVVAKIKEELEKIEQTGKAQTQAKKVYAAIKNREPSLTEELDAALRSRVKKERTYRRPSRQEVNDVILKGRMSIPRPPLVEIFIDRSGSFSPEKTAEAEKRLKTLLAKYGASITADVWYFADDNLSAVDLLPGGNTPYDLIAKHLRNSMPKIAIVITDDDPVPASVKPVKGPIVLCVPVGCESTELAARLNGKNVI